MRVRARPRSFPSWDIDGGSVGYWKDRQIRWKIWRVIIWERFLCEEKILASKFPRNVHLPGKMTNHVLTWVHARNFVYNIFFCNNFSEYTIRLIKKWIFDSGKRLIYLFTLKKEFYRSYIIACQNCNTFQSMSYSITLSIIVNNNSIKIRTFKLIGRLQNCCHN